MGNAQVKKVFKKTPKTATSITQAQETVNEKESQQSEQIQKAKERASIQRNSIFDASDLKQAWEDYANSDEVTNSPIIATIMKGCKYELLDNHKILLYLNNTLQETQFNRLQPKLLKALRDELQNDLIMVGSEFKELSQNEQSKRLYTDDDKLKFLMEEYPVFADLKEKLGLTFL
ncbi:MAG: hypothetical protein ACI85I_002587 [Arenicella sp.]|jgi:hypothetical protein